MPTWILIGAAGAAGTCILLSVLGGVVMVALGIWAAQAVTP